MRFNPKARLDTGRVRDVRGGGGGGRGGTIPVPAGLLGRGGVVGTLLVVGIVLYNTFVAGGGAGGYDTSRMAQTSRYASCETGADANASSDCARVAVENSLYDYWSGELGDRFRPERAVETFTGSTDTGCGPASADVGPFYCPTDQTIYLDTTFFDEVLEKELGGPDGGFVEAYVLAHEYGHHIQNLLGTMGRVRTQQGANSDSVRLELQADCYAGMWAKAATSTDDGSGQPLISELTSDDIRLALEAAASVGDDRIQSKTSGQVDEETWTHGSAQARERWFTTGYRKGSLQACDTFAVDRVE
ncbi:neutral zinc metallopeptidase [Nocardioides fonticola]|uniref:Neutral zinc metallopeptidase n=1 Tax=Nocardioides fonticola TaxID=450363 RepID=A0ABP7XUB5_9ACTN